MTLDELEKLADAAKVFGTNYSTGVAQPLYESVRVMPQTIKSLIALCRFQHEALINACLLYSMPPEVEDALAAYEEFGKTGEVVEEDKGHQKETEAECCYKNCNDYACVRNGHCMGSAGK